MLFSASGCQVLCHSVINSHLFFPITVECILCMCDLEEGTVKVRHIPGTLCEKEKQCWLKATCQALKSFACFPWAPPGHLVHPSTGIWVLSTPFMSPSIHRQWDEPEGTFDEHVWLASKEKSVPLLAKARDPRLPGERSHEVLCVLCL